MTYKSRHERDPVRRGGHALRRAARARPPPAGARAHGAVPAPPRRGGRSAPRERETLARACTRVRAAARTGSSPFPGFEGDASPSLRLPTGCSFSHVCGVASADQPAPPCRDLRDRQCQEPHGDSGREHSQLNCPPKDSCRQSHVLCQHISRQSWVQVS